MAELEKCPFCGGKAEWGTVLKTWIVCESCGFETPYSQDTEETIRMWNNRTANKEIRAKAIDEVLEVVKKAYHNFSGYDLEFMTKYGNKNASQQAESYSTLMMYEVAGEFDDLIDNLEQLKGGAS